MIRTVKVAAIRPDPNQPRTIFEPDYILGLANSIKAEGLINPIECDPTLMIITGESRYRAVKELGWKKPRIRG